MRRPLHSALRIIFALVLTVGTAACGGDDDVGTPGDSGPAADTGSAAGDASTPGDDAGPGTDAGIGTDAGPVVRGPTSLPSPTGTCPDFASGVVTFSPAGIAPRPVRIWTSDAAATLDGPLIFYWHGTGSSPMEAVFGLGSETIDAILALGGMVAAPVHDPTAGTWPWFLVASTREDDLRIADEVLACAIERVGVDTSRIHSAGMSAGGIQTTQMATSRPSATTGAGTRFRRLRAPACGSSSRTTRGAPTRRPTPAAFRAASSPTARRHPESRA